MLPIVLNMIGRLAVVVGGGPVGRRKVAALLDAGARVRLVCLEPRPDAVVHDHLEWLSEPYRAGHLGGAGLVFAAATPAVNRLVIADARGAGIWVNAATEPEAGDFFLPSTLRRGPFTIGVSTGGAAPHLARLVRQKFEAEFDTTFAGWVELLGEIRAEVLARVADPRRRRDLLEAFSGWDWLDRFRSRGAARTRAAMRDAVARALDDPPGSV